MINNNLTDEATLRGMIEQQSQAWDRGDAKTWCSFFTDDVRFIAGHGDSFVGRPTLEKAHVFIFGHFYKGSTDVSTVENVTFLTPELAVVDVFHEVKGYASLPPNVSETTPGVLNSRLRSIAIKQGSEWKFLAAQNTDILPKPDRPQR